MHDDQLESEHGHVGVGGRVIERTTTVKEVVVQDCAIPAAFTTLHGSERPPIEAEPLQGAPKPAAVSDADQAPAEAPQVPAEVRERAVAHASCDCGPSSEGSDDSDDHQD